MADLWDIDEGDIARGTLQTIVNYLASSQKMTPQQIRDEVDAILAKAGH